MKYAIFLMCLFCFGNVQSQDNPFLRGECSIIGPQKVTDYQISHPVGEYYVKVRFTIICKTDGSHKFPESRIQDLKNALDNTFNPHNINFIYDCETHYIQNNEIYNINPYFTTDIWNEINHSKVPIDSTVINIYLRKNKLGGTGTLATSGGVGNNYFYITTDLQIDQYENDYPWISMIQHEMGHCLGLYHTAYGSGKNKNVYYDYKEDTNGDSLINTEDAKHFYLFEYYWVDEDGNRHLYPTPSAESVNGMNGSITGDYVPDTKASNHCLELNVINLDILNTWPDYYDLKFWPNRLLLDSSSMPTWDVDNSFYCGEKHKDYFTYIVGPQGNPYYVYQDVNDRDNDGNTTEDIIIDDVLRNYMSENPKQDARDHFTPGQVDRMRSLLENNTFFQDYQLTEQEALAYCDCAQPGQIDINQNTTYTTDMTITKDIVVHAGVVLTVRSTLRFVPDAALYVEKGAKLILDGGTLTADCPTLLWKGIRVQGNPSLIQPAYGTMPLPNQSGMVVTNAGSTENAQISYAEIGIYTADDRYSGLFGGVIYASNTNFINNDRAVAFMKYGDVTMQQMPNKSFFKNCNFVDNNAPDNIVTTGVTIWSTYGIEFSYCLFKDLDDYGIAGIDYGVLIHKECVFKGISEAVGSSNTAPFQGAISVVGNSSTTGNVFLNNRLSVSVESGDRLGGAQIFYNSFTISPDYDKLATLGILIEGSTSFDVQNNLFTDILRPFQVENSGENPGFFICNSMTYNVNNTSSWKTPIGIQAIGLNSSFKFLDNTFSITTGACAPDVRLIALMPGQQVVAPEQGSILHPAGNCFTKDGRLEIETRDHPAIFNYWIPTPSEMNACYIPTNNLDDGGTNRYHLDTTSHGVEGCLQSINGYTNNTSGNMLSGAASLSDSVAYYWEKGNYNKVKTVLRNKGTSHSKRELYGVYIALGQLDSAEIILNNIPVITLDDQYFKQVQELNLERLNENAWPVYWTLQERQLLHTIARSDVMSAAYAKALLKLAGNDVPIAIEYKGCNKNNPLLRRQVNRSTKNYSVFPNPAHDKITVSWNNAQKVVSEWAIYDIQGRKVSEGKYLRKGQSIRTDYLPSGTYILSISDENGETSTIKFVIQ